jgi:RHS protein
MFCVEDRINTALYSYDQKLPDGMIHPDHLATQQKMTDGTGTVVFWSADYKPFGKATVTVSTITNNLGCPGQ